MFSCLVEGRGKIGVSTGGTGGISGTGVSLFARMLFRRPKEILRCLGVLGLSEVGRFCVVTQSSLADLFGSITLESFLLRLLWIFGAAVSAPGSLSVPSLADRARPEALSAVAGLSEALAALRFGTLF